MRIGMLFAVVAVAFLPPRTFATPSTLIWIPSTDIQAVGTTHFGVDVYAPTEGSSLLVTGLTFGSRKIEYGFDYLRQDGLEDPLRLNIKALLRDEGKHTPRIVIGAFDIGSGAASNIAYMLASKSIGTCRVTGGWAIGKKSTMGEDNSTVLLGVDANLSDRWWGAIDYQSGKSGFGALSAGISYRFTPKTSLILGYDWYNASELSDTLTVQLDIDF